MRKRSKSREVALRVLYQHEITKDTIMVAWDSYTYFQEDLDDEVAAFTSRILKGIEEQFVIIDERITEAANNWEMNRMAIIDRNILRIGVYELLYAEDIPPKVTINEAVEIAKRYGDSDSSKFINGILDRVHKQYVPSKSD